MSENYSSQTNDPGSVKTKSNLFKTEQPPTRNNFDFKHRGFHIANLNIRHIKPKIDELKIILDQGNCSDIFGVFGTFLNETVSDDVLHIKNYKIKRNDRKLNGSGLCGNGGGVLIYIADHVKYSRRFDLESSDIESIWLEIKVENSKPFLICSVYRPPSSASNWCDIFSDQIDKAVTVCDEIYIMGDLNIDFKNGQLMNTKWKNLIESDDLRQVINAPTRVTAHSQTTLIIYMPLCPIIWLTYRVALL